MELVALSPVFGFEVRGLDLGFPLPPDEAQGLRRAWSRGSLLVFRGQKMDDAALVRFSRHFGELELPPASSTRRAGDGGITTQPEIWVISNVVENGKPIGALGYGEAEWHTDMSYIDTPPTASVLYGLEVPPVGADTWFASQHAAFEGLPAELKEKLAGRRVNHDSSYTSAGELRSGASAPVTPDRAPGARHPIVRTHPETGRPALYLGRRRNGWIEGLKIEESEALLDRLWAECVRDDYVYKHKWQQGDLLIWDNRAVVHRRDAFDNAHRRVLLRTQVRGNKPF
ncbi:TauD/TfdA dioxygenase family protein [Desertibaculum subflavum]|uniref:TauD/TfdA dioxygenase family protein n=1 Tax=Desertibaculum subflavum TaxID=2268458 RepID=UPI000E674A44